MRGATRRIIATHATNVGRSRWLLVYTGLLALAAVLLVWLGGSAARALVSLINVVLLLVPLMAVVFGTLYVYNAREFTELLLTQPVERDAAYFGLVGGLAVPLVVAFLVGVGVPLGFAAFSDLTILPGIVALLGVGTLLVLVFTAFAVALAVRVEDRAWGLGAALLVWLVCTVIYDGLILLLLATVRDRPLEIPVLVMTMLNPIDVARIQLLLTFDIAALLGYTGTVYERVFSGLLGRSLAVVVLLVCAMVPLLVGRFWFRRKDF
ncbi:MAG: ABC transporter permease [Gemmatimonadetes bacterium]|nr:ABC transporter permease [Gemmatimonadota bacterium]